jgi:hypothetical protein
MTNSKQSLSVEGDTATMSETLKSCPWCGTSPRIDNWGNGSCVRIYCNGVGCAVYPSVRKYANGDALERASAAWNSRSPLEDNSNG